MKAAGSLNNQLVPADVPAFIDFYKLYPHRFREAVVVAFVKEPGPIEIFIRHLSGVESAEQPLEHVRQAWRATVGEVVRLGQDLNAVQQLSRQGTCRFSCLARSMSIIGIIEASSSTVAGENCFPLGVPPTYYQYCDNPQIFTTFYNDFETANEKRQRREEELDFNMFCRHVKGTMSVAGNASSAFGLNAKKYCYDFAVRKFILSLIHI